MRISSGSVEADQEVVSWRCSISSILVRVSTLEAKTRQSCRAHDADQLDPSSGEFPLEWKGRTYLFDFNFERRRTILETNGRRWHDDPADYERDNEKWSVPGRHGYKLVFATWEKVTRHPLALIEELRATLG